MTVQGQVHDLIGVLKEVRLSYGKLSIYGESGESVRRSRKA